MHPFGPCGADAGCSVCWPRWLTGGMRSLLASVGGPMASLPCRWSSGVVISLGLCARGCECGCGGVAVVVALVALPSSSHDPPIEGRMLDGRRRPSMPWGCLAGRRLAKQPLVRRDEVRWVALRSHLYLAVVARLDCIAQRSQFGGVGAGGDRAISLVVIGKFRFAEA